MRLHRLLDRQLRKLGLTSEAPPPSLAAWSALLDRISATYAESDEDRYLLERSLSISSREMRARRVRGIGFAASASQDSKIAIRTSFRAECASASRSPTR